MQHIILNVWYHTGLRFAFHVRSSGYSFLDHKSTQSARMRGVLDLSCTYTLACMHTLAQASATYCCWSGWGVAHLARGLGPATLWYGRGPVETQDRWRHAQRSQHSLQRRRMGRGNPQVHACSKVCGASQEGIGQSWGQVCALFASS